MTETKKETFKLSEYDKSTLAKAKLDPEVKAKWVAALRSGKYPQGAGHLKVHLSNEPDPRFCCLGVLCDIEGIEFHRGAEFTDGALDETGVSYYIEGKTLDGEPYNTETYLPSAFAEQVGLLEVDLILASFNDAGASFGEIADWIEAYL